MSTIIAPQPEYLRISELANSKKGTGFIPVSRACIYVWIKDKAFPAPYHIIGGNTAVWRLSEVREWLDKNLQKSEAPA